MGGALDPVGILLDVRRGSSRSRGSGKKGLTDLDLYHSLQQYSFLL